MSVDTAKSFCDTQWPVPGPESMTGIELPARQTYTLNEHPARGCSSLPAWSRTVRDCNRRTNRGDSAVALSESSPLHHSTEIRSMIHHCCTHTHCPGHSLCHPKFVVGPEVCGATRDWKFVDGHDVNARVRLEDVCLVDETCALRFVRTPSTCKAGSAARL